MLTKETVIEKLREDYSYLAIEYGVKRIGLFGSFAAGTADEASDIDVVVEFEQPVGYRFVELVDHLEHLLGRKVDVLTPIGIQGIRVRDVADEIEETILYV